MAEKFRQLESDSPPGLKNPNLDEIEYLTALRLPKNCEKDCEAVETRKVIILGNSGKFKIVLDSFILYYLGVGKSAILNRLTHDRFDSDHNCTIGVEFGSLAVKVEDTRIKLQIWDTAGMECFRSVLRIFYRDA